MPDLFQGTLNDLRSRLPKAQTVLVLYGEGEQMPVQACHGMQADQVWTTAPMSLTVLRRARLSGEPVFLTGNGGQDELSDITSLVVAGIRAVICVPVRNPQRQVKGLLYVDQRVRQDFQNTDLVTVIQVGRELERKLEGTPAPPPPRRVRPSPKPPPEKTPEKPEALGLSSRSRVMFLRGLATMLRAGIPIGRALTFLSQQPEDPRLGEVARRILESVERGKNLSVAMVGCGCFSEFVVRLVRVGEETGLLSDVLADLATHEEKSRDLVMRVRSKLTYPLLIFGVCLAMLVVLPPLALNGPLKAITDLGAETPTLTRVVVGVSGAVGSPLGLAGLAGLAVAAGLALQRLRAHPKGRLRLQQQLLRLGPIGRGLRLLSISRFAIALALLLRSGVGLLKAIPCAVASTEDPVLESLQPGLVEALSGGASLAEALQDCGYFPRTFVAVLLAGEQTGQLDRTLPWIADLYTLELESALDVACAALEPILMLGMGVTAAVIALAVMLPMVKLTQSL